MTIAGIARIAKDCKLIFTALYEWARVCEITEPGYNAPITSIFDPWRHLLRGIFAALQLFAAFFLSVLGLAMIFGHANYFGAFLASLGLTFLALLAINIRKQA